MKPFPPLLTVTGCFVLFLGLFFGLYALLTRGRRRTMREIRSGASTRGWRYRLSRWQGDPTAFRIDGRTENGLTWILKCGGSSGYDRGWCVRLGLRFPILAGETDLTVMPRDPTGHSFPALGDPVASKVQARVAAFSAAGAGAIGFLQSAREFPSGLSAFDAAYQVLALPRQIRQSPLDPALAERILHWPPDTVAPHSVLVWRDPFGLYFQARLPAPPNWATIRYFLALAEDFCVRLPAPEPSPAPRTFLDRLIARVMR
jgi:hypothetical protein